MSPSEWTALAYLVTIAGIVVAACWGWFAAWRDVAKMRAEFEQLKEQVDRQGIEVVKLHGDVDFLLEKDRQHDAEAGL